VYGVVLLLLQLTHVGNHQRENAQGTCSCLSLADSTQGASPIATPKLISMRFFIANMSALACSAALPTRGTTMVVKKGIGTRSCLLASAQDKQHNQAERGCRQVL
jgi:hypothetical protein